MDDPKADINRRIQAKISSNEFTVNDPRIREFAGKMFEWEKAIGNVNYFDQYIKTLKSVFKNDKELE